MCYRHSLKPVHGYYKQSLRQKYKNPQPLTTLQDGYEKWPISKREPLKARKLETRTLDLIEFQI